MVALYVRMWLSMCTYVALYVRMWLYVYVCGSLCTYVALCVRMWLYVYVCGSLWVRVRSWWVASPPTTPTEQINTYMILFVYVCTFWVGGGVAAYYY